MARQSYQCHSLYPPFLIHHLCLVLPILWEGSLYSYTRMVRYIIKSLIVCVLTCGSRLCAFKTSLLFAKSSMLLSVCCTIQIITVSTLKHHDSIAYLFSQQSKLSRQVLHPHIVPVLSFHTSLTVMLTHGLELLYHKDCTQWSLMFTAALQAVS